MSEQALEGVEEARRLLDALESAPGQTSLREVVEVFEAVQRALDDALAEAES